MSVCFPALGQVGRLGNQLWELASTVGLARSRGEDPCFPHWAYEPFFSVPAAWFRDDCEGVDAATLVSHIHPSTAVYLQDYGLWRHAEPTIRWILRPSELAWTTLRSHTAFRDLERPILSVHVRRGDNVPGADPGTPDKHLYHPMPEPWYYQNAIARHHDAASIAVFSDDIAWCREHLEADYFHEGTSRPKEHEAAYATAPVLDWIDLQLMAQCDMHVISNSTYAWWGAFLAGDPAPIYPEPWFGPKLDHIDSSLMFPPTWRPLRAH